MIKTKEDLRFFLDADRFALGKSNHSGWRKNRIWRFQILMRKAEYYYNQEKSWFNTILYEFHRMRKRKLGRQLGFIVGNNAFGPGARINHFGNLIVAGKGNIGMWCDIHQGINIGNNNSPDKSKDVDRPLVPDIGRNVWIGPGVKMFGAITIGDGVTIGANAVVTKDFPSNVTIVGVPARVLRKAGTEKADISANPARTIKFWEQNPQYAHYREVYDPAPKPEQES